jgi:hypothetical protein
MQTENGIRCFCEGAKANASTLNGWGNDYLRAECQHETLELDRRCLRVPRGGPWHTPVREELPLLVQPAWTNAWLAELFCQWLLGGPEPPNSLDDNIRCAALLFAAIESALTGEVVDVEEFLRRHMEAVEQADAGDI